MAVEQGLVTDPETVRAIQADFSRTVREAARVATLRMLGRLPAPQTGQGAGMTDDEKAIRDAKREKRRVYMGEYRRRTAERSLVSLFDEAVALARDEALDDAARGRRLVELLDMSESRLRRVRLTHFYGRKLAEGIIATIRELGPWRLHWPALTEPA